MPQPIEVVGDAAPEPIRHFILLPIGDSRQQQRLQNALDGIAGHVHGPSEATVSPKDFSVL